MNESQDKFSFPVAFQTDIISYLLHDSNLFRKFIKYVKTSYFSEYQLREIVDVSLEFFKKYGEIPNKTSMLNEINNICIRKNGVQGVEDYQGYVNKIYEFSFNKEYISDNLVRFIKIQAIYKGLQKASTAMDDENFVLKTIEEATQVGHKLQFDKGYDYKKRINERVDSLKQGIRTKNQIKIQMVDLDRVTNGGLGSGELGVVLGRPKSGKSIFLCNVALGACMLGKKVVYYTMEANEDILGHRLDSQLSHYTEKEKQGRLDKLEMAVSKLGGELIIKEFPGLTTSPMDLANHVNGLIADDFYPDLVIADYIGILSSCTRQKEKRHAIQDVCRGLIDYVGKKFCIPIWSAHQSSNVEDDSDNIYALSSGKKKTSKLLGLRDISEGKIALASEVTFLVSLNQDVDDKRMSPELLKLFVVLNRIGKEKQVFNMTLDRDRFTIAETGITNTLAFQ